MASGILLFNSDFALIIPMDLIAISRARSDSKYGLFINLPCISPVQVHLETFTFECLSNVEQNTFICESASSMPEKAISLVEGNLPIFLLI